MFARKISGYQFCYSVLRLLVGGICADGGIALLIQGVTGSTGRMARELGLNDRLTETAVGSVFGILGSFIVFVTLYKIVTDER